MRLFVTGMGIVSGLGVGKDATLNGILSRRTSVGRMKFIDSIHTEIPVAEVPYSNEQLKTMGDTPDGVNVRTALMGRVALLEALEQAGLNNSPRHGKGMAFIFGTTVGGMDMFEKGTEKISDFIECGSCTEQIIKGFNGFDIVTTTSTACSSALNSIIVGAEMIRSGRVDTAVCGGGECLSKYHLNGFNSLMILDSKPCRPFDNSRAGLNLGEGAAFLVLESEESLHRRGMRPIAELCGYGNACDAYHQTASSPAGDGAYLAMKQAIDSAGLSIRDIDYINAHGTGTPNNDPSEVAAMHRLYGDTIPPVSSTKGYTGHTTSASGTIESVISIIAMQKGFIPANLNFSVPMEESGFMPSTGNVKYDIRYVQVNAFGFGGNDSSCIFGRAEGRI